MNYWTGLLHFSDTNGGFVGSVRRCAARCGADWDT